VPSLPRTSASTEGYRVPPGPSIIESIWAELDAQTGKMMAIKRHEDGSPTEEEHDLAEAGQRGHCLGLAKALAILHNPYDPDIEEIRREAMRRYRTRGE
jgi:hypothetical protein